jgi:hypothetical protein
MEPNNSRHTPTKTNTHLPSWYGFPNMSKYKMAYQRLYLSANYRAGSGQYIDHYIVT